MALITSRGKFNRAALSMAALSASLLLTVSGEINGSAQSRQEPTKDKRSFAPVVEVQKEDYAEVRRRFRTKLSSEGPSPQKEPMYRPPDGVTEIEYASEKLRLKAWINQPKEDTGPKRPAVLFCHGGFAFGPADWKMTLPYRDAGYVVMVPILRGENGQAGSFSLFYDEVDDVLAAAAHLSKLPYVDADRLYIAGHSAGGNLALLAAMATKRFRAAASFDATPDLAVFLKPDKDHKEVRFDLTDSRELQVRSPLAYVNSLKCPARLYYSQQAAQLKQMTEKLAELAKARRLDVEAILVEGNHVSHVAPAMKQSIEFFEK